MDMAWYYALPQAEKERLEREVYNPVTDAIADALEPLELGGWEIREIAEAAGQIAMFRDAHPFVRAA